MVTSVFNKLACAVLTTVTGAIITADTASAEILVDESFDYVLGGSISGQNGGTGFASAFTGDGLVGPNLVYPGIESKGNGYSTDGSKLAFRDFANSIDTDSGTIYLRFLISIPGALPTYTGLSFFTEGSEELFLGKTWASSVYGFDVSGAGLPQGQTSNTIVSSVTSLLVFRLSFSAAGDTIDMFVNPGDTLNGLTPDATLTTPGDDGALSDSFNRFRLAAGFEADTSVYFDEVRLATTELEVLAIPEPGTGVLGLIGFGAMGLRRSRRK